MSKRNAHKQATREDIELSDPVCRKLSDLADDADLLLLTEGADYDGLDDPSTLAGQYGQRLTYLPTLLAELMDFRVRLVIHEAAHGKSETEQPAETAPEGDDDATDVTETAE